MEKIERYSGPSDLVTDSEGDLVFYEDHKCIVEQMQNKIEYLEDCLFDTQCRMSEMVEP